MVILYGKTASGKDAILNKMVDDYGYKKIITYTTRPKRENEEDGVDYHFISDEEFDKRIDDRFFAEYQPYHTADGVWKYGCSREDIENADDKSVIILTPSGIESVIGLTEKNPQIIYVYANNYTISKRLRLRGDKKEEANRRISHDNKDFKDKEELAHRIVYNNLDANLDRLVKDLVVFLEEDSKQSDKIQKWLGAAE